MNVIVTRSFFIVLPHYTLFKPDFYGALRRKSYLRMWWI